MVVEPALAADLAVAVAAIRARIARAAESVGRDPATVTLIAVTKTQPLTRIAAAHACGIMDFGENRVQEALLHFAPTSPPTPPLRREGSLDYALDAAYGAEITQRDSPPPFVGEGVGGRGLPRTGLRLHLIGPLQRNKARRAAAFFDTIQSVDRIDLAQALEQHRAADWPDAPPLPVLIEVNISGEASKSGVAPADVPALADALRACPHLLPQGLMTVGAPGLSEAAARRQFAAMRALRDALAAAHPDLPWSSLSMGMSDDFEAAIREGATQVRLGRVLFGAREGAL
ncbi:MAG: YggS family pyridoxal phosphate-dependent enzyme [Chloroflexota bacterium]|nr:YggS family pyridoxal phosphate-dependent enzyme [Chloroflexota bacterium]